MNNNKEITEQIRNLLFIKIFQAFRIAIHPKNLVIAFLGTSAIFIAGWLMDINKTVAARADDYTELEVYLFNPEQVPDFIEEGGQAGKEKGVFSTLQEFCSMKLNNAVFSLLQLNVEQFNRDVFDSVEAVKWAYKYHTGYCVIFALIKLAIIAVAGGAICRIAALQFAQGEKPGIFEALSFSTKKFISFFAAPIVPVCIIIFVGFFIFLFGLITNIPYAGEIILGISMPIVLLGGIVLSIIAIGAAAGFNLMFPAIAFEGSDSFDAVSRSLSYIYAKPWRMVFYTGIASIYGFICYAFVRFFAFLLLVFSHSILSLGIFTKNSDATADKLSAIWPEFNISAFLSATNMTAASWYETAGAILIAFWVSVVIGFVVSFVLSFYFSANTIIYSLLRNRIDGTDIKDVYIDSEGQVPKMSGAEANNVRDGQ